MLSRSENRFRTIFEKTDVGITLASTDGTYSEANPAFCRITGYSRAELTGMNFSAISHPESLAAESERIRGLVAGEYDSYGLEKRYIRKDGSAVWVYIVVTAIRDEFSRIEHLSGLVYDISGRKEAEEQIRLYSSAMEQSLASILITDRDGVIRYANPAYLRLTGYTKEEVIGAKPSILKSGRQDPKVYDRLWQTITAGRTWQGDLINKRKNGELFWESALISPVTDDSGAITHFVAIKEDISNRKALEDELRRAHDEAKNAENVKSGFLANMSHEIRTPLNAIIGLTHLLSRSSLDAQQRDYVDKVTQSSSLLLGLLNDILDISKIDAGRIVLEETEFELEPLFRTLASVNVMAAAERRLDLVFDIAPEVRGVKGDPFRLTQILMNLLSNAIKFTEFGSVVLRMESVTGGNGTALLKFAVTDTGRGMEPDEQQRLFKPFVQADSSTTRRYGGTGLGLAICQSLAGLMGSRIEVNSTPGTGSTFSFNLILPITAMNRPPSIPAPENRRITVILPGAARRNAVARTLQWLRLPHTLLSETPLYIPDGSWLILADAPALAALSERLREADDIRTISVGGIGEASAAAASLADPLLPGEITSALQRILGIAPEGGEPARGEHPLAGRRILVVDDNRINLLVTQKLLENEGMAVSLAASGAEAIDLVCIEGYRPRYDAIIMDIQMPDMDGLEVTRIIRKNALCRDIPIIALSADVIGEVTDRALASGMNDVLTKPVDPNTLFATLGRHFG